MVDHHAPWVFIGGTGRCGTNALKDSLSLSSDVFSLPFESRVTIDPDGVVPTYVCLRDATSPLVAARAMERFSRLVERTGSRSWLDSLSAVLERGLRIFGFQGSLRAYRDWELDLHFPGFVDDSQRLIGKLSSGEFRLAWHGAGSLTGYTHTHIVPSRDAEELRDLFSQYFCGLIQKALKRAGASIYVDDNTFNTLFAREICELVPHAKIIHMIRDPRDVIASYVQQRWAPKGVALAIEYYMAVVNRWFLVRESLDAERLLEVRLEDLCQDEQQEFARVCDFCHIEQKSLRRSPDLSRPNVGRWHIDLSASDAELVNTRMAGIISRFGYD